MAKCKYPNEICPNMTVYHGVAYCDSVPCSLKDELPKRTNADRIREMTNEELAELLERAENAGYNDSSITPKDENNFHIDMLEWPESECDAEC